MAPSSEAVPSVAAPATRKRAVIIVLAGVALLAAVFFVAKVMMPHTAPSNPIAPITSAAGKARAAAAASNAATAKIDAATGSGATTTTVASVAGSKSAAPAGSLAGPAPNTTRNPFLP